jgi:hypothetical protein
VANRCPPTLSFYGLEPDVSGIIGEQLLYLARGDPVAGDMAGVPGIPIEAQLVPHRQLVYIQNMYTASRTMNSAVESTAM